MKSRQAVPLAELLEQVATMLEKELAELNGSYDSMESAARSQKSVDIPEGEDAESIMAHRNVLNHILGLRKNMASNSSRQAFASVTNRISVQSLRSTHQ